MPIAALLSRNRPAIAGGHLILDQTARECRLAASGLMGGASAATKRVFDPTCEYAIVRVMILTLAIMFLLGTGNFAMHSAVLDSGHPLTQQMPSFVQLLGGRFTLVAEFFVLLAAMLLAANGWPALVWVYGGYTSLNALSAWLMLSGRV